MHKAHGMTLLELMITMVIVAVFSTVLFKLTTDAWRTEAKVKRLIAAGHAIEAAIERKRIEIAANPGQARTPTSEPVPGNFPSADTTWPDTDLVNSIVVTCSTGTAYDKEDTPLENVRTLTARADIFADRGSVNGLVLDTLTIRTAISRHF